MTGPVVHVAGVHHVSFRVDSLSDALRFYVDVLGCERIERPELGFPGAWMCAGGTEVHLIESPATDRTGFPPTSAPLHGVANHVAFHVADLEVARRRLEDAGYIVEAGAVLRQLFVQDPSGNVNELTETVGGVR